jgi:hypothetical protein
MPKRGFRRPKPPAQSTHEGSAGAVSSSTQIKDQLLSVGEQENGGGEAMLPKDEISGAEHLKAAEGAMTFRTLGEERDGDWMDKKLTEIAKDYKTGPYRPQRSPFARRVLGA